MTGDRSPHSHLHAPVHALTLDAEVRTVLSWCYDQPADRIGALYEAAKSAQWNATEDIDWSLEVPYGAPLPAPSAHSLATFRASPLRERGIAAWDAFRWELQAWMIGQFLHGEQAAMVSAARLVEVLPDVRAKLYAASQAVDEARHTEAFARYTAEHLPDPYPISPALQELFEDGLRAREWDVTALAVQCLVEPVALAGFRMAGGTFHDDLIRQIVTKVARDEARHVSYGVLLLKDVIPELTDAERAHREEFVLESLALLRRRFLLVEVWERMGVDAQTGAAFTAQDPGLTAYRQALFSRVVPLLGHIGLLTPRVVHGMEDLGLLDRAALRTVRRAGHQGPARPSKGP
ncbi:ferritin-like domain-containing protein [Streptomyces sp. NPDC046870]|uniref:ferritin-like domain-containing protein n=1 Tax=Streptomyces sp. NPDC046870 TaxID=3155135 RepID=UPI003452B1B4